MPALVVAAVSYVGSTLFAGTVVGAFLMMNTVAVANAVMVAGALAYGQSQKRRAARRARDASNASLRDRELMLRGATAPSPVIYGRAKVSGPLVYAQSTGTKGEYLHLVIALARHPCAAIDTVYFNDVALPAEGSDGMVRSGEFSKPILEQFAEPYVVTGSGTVTINKVPARVHGVIIQNRNPLLNDIVPHTASPPSQVITGIPGNYVGTQVVVSYEVASGDPLVRIRKHLGRIDQIADPELVVESEGKWTGAHRGRNVTYLYVRLKYDQEIFGQIGVPNISAVVRGKLVYDPRIPDGQPQEVWSENSALCVADYLRDGAFGLGCAAEEVPEAELITAANICDESVVMYDPVDSANTVMWSFSEDFNAEGWVPYGANYTVQNGYLRLHSNITNYLIENGVNTPLGSVNFNGADKQNVLMRIRRILGAGWNGLLYYGTPNHGPGNNWYDQIPEPVWGIDGWATLHWDMTTPLVGGNDWVTSQINYLRFYLGGFAGDLFEIDWIAVVGNRTYKRYTTNGALDSDVNVRDNLDSLCDAMAGSAVWVQGRWLIRAGAHQVPVLSLNEDALAGGSIEVMARQGRRDLFNAVSGIFIDPAQGYAEAQFPTFRSPTYKAEDNQEEIVQDVVYPLSDSSQRCQRLAKIELLRARQALTTKLTFNGKGYDLAPSDTVALTLVRYGWAAKVFVVVSRKYSIVDNAVEYVLRETAPQVWDWSFDESQVPDPAPNTSLPNWAIRPAPLQGLTVSTGTAHLIKLADGTVITRAYVTWTQSSDIFVVQGGRIEVGWKYATSNIWQPGEPVTGDSTHVYLQPMPERTVIAVRARAVSSTGRTGLWQVVFVQVIGKTQQPSDVSGLNAAAIPGGVVITWTANPDVDHDVTELRVGSPGATWATAGRLFRGDATTHTWVNPGPGSYVVVAKHYDTSGNESANGSILSFTVTAANLITGGNLNVTVSGANLLTNSSFEQDENIDNMPDGWGAYNVGSLGTVSYGVTTGVDNGKAFYAYASAVQPSFNNRFGIYHATPIYFGRGAAPKMTISAQVIGTGGGRIWVYVDAYSDGTHIQGFAGSADATGGWQRVSHTFAVPGNANQLYFYIWYTERTTPAAAVLYVDRASCQIGDVLTDWSLGPTDTLNSNVAQSGNLISNSEFTGRAVKPWFLSDGIGLGFFGTELQRVGATTSPWVPYGADALVAAAGSPSGSVADLVGEFVQVVPGQRLEFSAYLSTHRCGSEIYVGCYSADATTAIAFFESHGSGTYSYPDWADGGSTHASFSRVGIFFTVPGNCFLIRPIFRRGPTHAGQASSYAWFLHPYLGLAGATQTKFTDYAPAPPKVPTQITGANSGEYVGSAAVVTDHLQDEAATQVVSTTVSLVSVTFSHSAPDTETNTQLVASIAMVPVVSGQVLVTVVGEAVVNSPSAPGTIGGPRFSLQVNGAYNSFNRRGLPNISTTFSASQRFSVTAGITVTFSLRFTRTPGDTVSVQNVEMRAELIKR